MVNGFNGNIRNPGQAFAYFGVGAVSGAAGAGIGAGISSAMAGTGFGAGFIGASGASVAGTSFLRGSAIGWSSGFSSGFLSDFGNSLIRGNKFGKSLVNGLISGSIAGASGALIGGLIGGIDALMDGRRFFDGAKVIRTTLLEQNIPSVVQAPEGCLAACMKAIDESLGGTLTMDEINRLIEGVPGGARDATSWEKYANFSNRKLDYNYYRDSAFDQVLTEMRKGARVSVNLNLEEKIGHSVVIRSIHSKMVFKLNGKESTSYFLKIMNPNSQGINVIGIGNLKNALNIFYIY